MCPLHDHGKNHAYRCVMQLIADKRAIWKIVIAGSRKRPATVMDSSLCESGVSLRLVSLLVVRTYAITILCLFSLLRIHHTFRAGLHGI